MLAFSLITIPFLLSDKNCYCYYYYYYLACVVVPGSEVLIKLEFFSAKTLRFYYYLLNNGKTFVNNFLKLASDFSY